MNNPHPLNSRIGVPTFSPNLNELLSGKKTFSMKLGAPEKERFRSIASLVQKIRRKVGLNQNISLKLSAVASPYGIWTKRKDKNIQLSIHPVLLVEKRNLPDELQLSGPSDSKYDWYYVSRFRDWFKLKFSIPEDKTEWSGVNQVTTHVYLDFVHF